MSLFRLRYPLVALVLFSLFFGMLSSLEKARQLGTMNAFYTGELINLSRLNYELLEFERAANGLVMSTEPIEKKDVLLAFDVLWSRVHGTHARQFFVKVEELRKFENFINKLAEKLTIIDPVVQGLRPGDRQGIATINAELRPLIPQVSDFTSTAYSELLKHTMGFVELQRSAMQGLQRVQMWFLLFASGVLLLLVYQLERVKLLFRQLQRREQEISLLATTDPLTGLHNRREFDSCIATAGRDSSARQCNLLLIDLDGFKAVNDTYGHAAGDEVLREVALRLRMAARSEDKLARLGGDEFAMLVVGPSEVAVEIASRIVDVMREPFRAAGRAVRLSACVGIANRHGDSSTSEQMVHEADIALYHAKENGKNRFFYYSESLMRIAGQRPKPKVRSAKRRIKKFIASA